MPPRALGQAWGNRAALCPLLSSLAACCEPKLPGPPQPERPPPQWRPRSLPRREKGPTQRLLRPTRGSTSRTRTAQSTFTTRCAAAARAVWAGVRAQLGGRARMVGELCRALWGLAVWEACTPILDGLACLSSFVLPLMLRRPTHRNWSLARCPLTLCTTGAEAEQVGAERRGGEASAGELCCETVCVCVCVCVCGRAHVSTG